jgi:hypothetical protein
MSCGLVGFMVWLASGALTPMGHAKSIEIKPRRHSNYPPAYLIGITHHKEYLKPDGAVGSTRLFLLLAKPADRDRMLLTRDQLLDHYRIRPSQLNQVPTRKTAPRLGTYAER